MSKKKLILIDGNSLLHRAFYALPTLTNAQGEFTNAVYGFTMMLMRLLEDERPDYVAVAFDLPAPTFRHAAYKEYKANRPEMPDQLRPQIPLVKEVVRGFAIPIFEKEGYEADDVIGTLARLGAERGNEVLIVTGDRDCLQLVGENVKALITRRGIKDMERFDPAAVKEKFGVNPDQITDLKGLVGDTSDNIPGVPGIGEKTAVRLLTEFGSVESVIEHKDALKGKLKELIQKHYDQAIMSKELATIDRYVPIETDFTEYRACDWDREKLYELFARLEFRSLVEKVKPDRDVSFHQELLFSSGDEGQKRHAEEKRSQIDIVDSLESVERIVKQSKGPLIMRAIISGSGRTGEIAGIGLASQSDLAYIPLKHGGGEVLSSRAVFGALTSVFQGEGLVVSHDCKELILALNRWGIDVRCPMFDIAIASYLINPQGNHSISDIAMKLYNQYIPTLEDVLGKGAKAICPTDAKASDMALLVAEELVFMRDSYENLAQRIDDEGMSDLFHRIEMPLIHVLAKMESVGIRVDRETLHSLDEEFSEQIESLTKDIYKLAGSEFNINSPKQLGDILFTRLKLPVLKKTKTGPSTSADVLEELADEHEIVRLILEYRQLVKLKSTYVDALCHLIDEETGRVHTTFNQTVTATGRLSSTNPNLQNIPVRTAAGRRIRAAFVAGEPGWSILAADYSQIELRVLAHISGDETLIDAFLSGQDIHTRTASEVFGIDSASVTSEMRSAAKAINFGIVYGISSYGLARGTNLTREEAQRYINDYFGRYPKVKEYVDEITARARKDGYVTTIFNRRRYLPDLYSRNWSTRSFAERTAMNTPIQGSAADIIKLAMVEVAKRLADGKYDARMLLQVHDELVFEVPPGEIETLTEMVRETMENVVKLKVPLKVEVNVGPNWMEAK